MLDELKAEGVNTKDTAYVDRIVELVLKGLDTMDAAERAAYEFLSEMEEAGEVQPDPDIAPIPEGFDEAFSERAPENVESADAPGPRSEGQPGEGQEAPPAGGEAPLRGEARPQAGEPVRGEPEQGGPVESEPHRRPDSVREEVDFDAAFDAALDDTFGAKPEPQPKAAPQREEFRRPAEKPEAETDPSFLTGMSPEMRKVWDAADRPADKQIAVHLGRRIDKMRKAGNTDRAKQLETKLDGILQAIGVREHDRDAAFSAGATESRPQPSGSVRGFTAEEMAEMVRRGRARGKTYAGFDEPREKPKPKPEPERKGNAFTNAAEDIGEGISDAAVRAAKHAGVGLKDVLKGLDKLFGSGTAANSRRG